MKNWKKHPKKLLRIGPDHFFPLTSQGHSPQPKIDFPYHEISGLDICSLICVLDCLVQQQHKDANCLKSQYSQRHRTRRLILSFISGGGREPAGHGYIIYECMGLWVYGIYKQKRMFYVCNRKKVFCQQVIKKNQNCDLESGTDYGHPMKA